MLSLHLSLSLSLRSGPHADRPPFRRPALVEWVLFTLGGIEELRDEALRSVNESISRGDPVLPANEE